MAQNPNDTSRGVKLLAAFWPIILAALAVLVAGVRADARIDSTAEKVEYIYTKGPPPVVTELGVINTRLDNIDKTMAKIEKKLETDN
jgi:hypothetical protein